MSDLVSPVYAGNPALASIRFKKLKDSVIFPFSFNASAYINSTSAYRITFQFALLSLLDATGVIYFVENDLEAWIEFVGIGVKTPFTVMP